MFSFFCRQPHKTSQPHTQRIGWAAEEDPKAATARKRASHRVHVRQEEDRLRRLAEAEAARKHLLMPNIFESADGIAERCEHAVVMALCREVAAEAKQNVLHGRPTLPRGESSENLLDAEVAIIRAAREARTARSGGGWFGFGGGEVVEKVLPSRTERAEHGATTEYREQLLTQYHGAPEARMPGTGKYDDLEP